MIWGKKRKKEREKKRANSPVRCLSDPAQAGAVRLYQCRRAMLRAGLLAALMLAGFPASCML